MDIGTSFGSGGRRIGRPTIAALSFLFAATGSVPAYAATYAESVFGEFSSSVSSPTAIGPGYDAVTGSISGVGAANADMFWFTSLAPGSQDILISLTNTSAQYAGGDIYYKTTQLGWASDGTHVGQFSMTPTEMTKSYTVSLLDGFAGGSLYFSFTQTWGTTGIDYTVGDPSPPSSVPLPPALALLAGSLLGLGFISRRRAV